MALARQAPPIPPFWHRVPHFFLYPLRPPALWLPLGTAVILALTLPKLSGILIFLLLLFLVFLLFTYGYESLDATAQGNAEPPGIREVMAAGDWGLPLKQLGIMFAFGAFVAMADGLMGEFGGVLAGFMLSLLLPASVMVLGVERSFQAAVNPVYLWRVVRSIGWPFLGLLGLLLAQEGALGSAMYAVSWIVPDDAGYLPYIIGWSLVGVYFTVMYFHMLGYVVYQYHEALGYAVHVDGDEQDGLEGELAFFETLIAEERYEAALAELRTVLDSHPEHIGLHQRMYRLAGLTGNTPVRTREGNWLIRRLVRSARVADAVQVYLECLKEQPAFRPEAAEVYDPLARELRMQGKVRDALQLINGFHARFPGHALVPRVYILAAQMFIDNAGRPDQAAKILTYLTRHHPDSAYQSQVESLLRTLESRSAPMPDA